MSDTTDPSDIVALRKHLFDSIKRLAENGTPEEIARARAIAETGQTIINSAKVEVDFIRTAGGKGGSGFIPLAPPKEEGKTVVTERPGLRVTQHRLQG